MTGLLLGVVLAGLSATLNIRSSHNWGDDFAQYILQARNIVAHRSQLDTGVVQNSWSTLRLIPDATPIGWPLLLAGQYLRFGNDLWRFGQLVGIFTFFLNLIVLFYYRKYWGWGLALLTTSVLAFNPWLIDFKSSILTDIPFTVFLLAAVYLQVRSGRHSWGTTILSGLCIGYAIAIRPAGIALLLAIATYGLFNVIRKKLSGRQFLLHHGTTILVGLALSFLLNSVIFPTGIGSSYYGFWSKRIFQKSSTTAFSIQPETAETASLPVRYATTLGGEVRVFTQLVPTTGQQPVDVLFRFGFLLAVGLGLILRCMKPRMVEFFVIIYFLMLVVLQIRPEQGFRYLLPLMPFVFEYLLIALRWAGGIADRWLGGRDRPLVPARK